MTLSKSTELYEKDCIFDFTLKRIKKKKKEGSMVTAIQENATEMKMK